MSVEDRKFVKDVFLKYIFIVIWCIFSVKLINIFLKPEL